MSVLLPVAGVLLLLLLVGDVFSTVFSPMGRGGPLNRKQNRAIWTFFRMLGKSGSGSARDGWLALAGPVMVVITVGVWILLLVLGFALIYYPSIESFLVSPGSLRTPLLEVLYYSGYTAATLGFGDVVPEGELLRILAPVQALGGFALLSSSITYFLAVYRELIRKQSLAARIDSDFGGAEPGGVEAEFVHRLARGDDEAILRWSEGLSDALTAVLMAHYQYPVLHYFRSTNAWRSLPRQLTHLLELRRLVKSGELRPPMPALGDHPSYIGLQASLEKYLHEVDRIFTPGAEGHPEASESGDPLGRAHRRLLAYMCEPERS